MDQTCNVDWRKVSKALDSALGTSTETIKSLVAELKRVQEKNKRLLKDNEILAKNAAEAFQEGLNENRELFTEEILKEFARFLIDRTEGGVIPICDLLDLLIDFKEKKDHDTSTENPSGAF